MRTDTEAKPLETEADMGGTRLPAQARQGLEPREAAETCRHRPWSPRGPGPTDGLSSDSCAVKPRSVVLCHGGPRDHKYVAQRSQ